MALTKLFPRSGRKSASPILIEDLDRQLDVDVDRFPALLGRCPTGVSQSKRRGGVPWTRAR